MLLDSGAFTVIMVSRPSGVVGMAHPWEVLAGAFAKTPFEQTSAQYLCVLQTL